MPVRMEHIRGPRKCRHQIKNGKEPAKSVTALMEHGTRISNENHVIFALINWLHTYTKTPLDTVASIVKVATCHTERRRLRERKGGHQSVFGSGTSYPDPDPTSEKFHIRSRSYLAQYGISNTKSCLFNV